jgi:copper(I)-binding protein
MRRRIAVATATVLLCLASIAGAGPVGELVVKDAWARATPPGAGVAAAYLTIVGGAEADRLVGARSDVAAMTQVHSVSEVEGVARMRDAGRVEVAAGATVVLAPNGLHLMLMNLSRPLVAGERFVVTLRFERAGVRDVSVLVVAPDQSPPAHR